MATNDENALSAQELEAAFQAARDHAPMPSRQLWERVLADGEAHLPPPSRSAAARPVAKPVSRPVSKPAAPGRPRPRWRFAASGGWGGWGGLAGLVCAALFGLWIGFAYPVMAPDGRGAGPMAGGGQAGFELEDFEPRYFDFSALLEDG